LFVRDPVDPIVDPRPQLLVAETRELGLDQRRAHRARVVEPSRKQDAAHRHAVFRRREVAVIDARRQILLRVRGERADRRHALVHVIAIARIAGDFREAQHAGIRHAPLVGQDQQVRARKPDGFGQLRHVRRRAGLGIDRLHGRGRDDVCVHVLGELAHFLLGRELVRRRIWHLEAPRIDTRVLLRRCMDLDRRGLRQRALH
jgi:hypothetical protein